MAFAQTLAAEAISNEFALQPGESVDYLADTSDLDEATLVLQVSDNGTIWRAARDHVGALVADVVGSGGAESSSAILRNEKSYAVRYRAVLTETGTLAGEVAVTFTERDDVVAQIVNPRTGAVLATLSDESVDFAVPVTGTFNGGFYSPPIYADNAAAIAGGVPVGALWATAAGVVAAVVAE